MPDARLVNRFRPRALDELVGQAHLLGAGCPLGDAVRDSNLHSFVAWGPPGTGKSALLTIVAERLEVPVLGGATLEEPPLRALLERGARAICIDDVERLSPRLAGLLIAALDGGMLLAATSGASVHERLEPSLLSRLVSYRFRPLSTEALDAVAARVTPHCPRSLEPAALEHLVAHARGDARVLLDALERVSRAGGADEEVTLDEATRCTQPDRVEYPTPGTGHCDVVTAFVKSLRGSDPDAALYWLAAMLSAGEDAAFIGERICLVAAEDVGQADPFALVVARAACDCAARVPLEEARMPLAHAAVHVACAPKSNAAARGLERAEADIRARGMQAVPLHLRQRSLRGAPEVGYSQASPWRQPKGQFLFPQYLPDPLVRERFYEPSDSGAEARVKERLHAWWPERH